MNVERVLNAEGEGRHPMATINIVQHRVLLIDDDYGVLSALQRMILWLREDWTVSTAQSGEEGLEIMQNKAFDVVVSDMSMPRMHGRELLQNVQKLYPDVLRVALTGWVDEEWELRKQSIAEVLLSKPCSAEEVVASIESPLQYRPVIHDEFVRRVKRAPTPQRRGNYARRSSPYYK